MGSPEHEYVMTDTELILRTLLAIMEGQKLLAEAFDRLPEIVTGADDNRSNVRLQEVGPAITALERVTSPAGRHALTKTERKNGGWRDVEICRYDLLSELIADRLSSTNPRGV